MLKAKGMGQVRPESAELSMSPKEPDSKSPNLKSAITQNAFEEE
jgi:hypothetical protein